MTSDPERSLSDDDLIARLRRSEHAPPAHDPFLDLPVAREVAVEGDLAYRGPGTRCTAPARRPTAIHGAYGAPSYEQVSCELEAGHQGPHRAGFTRTHIRHRWRTYEWAP